MDEIFFIKLIATDGESENFDIFAIDLKNEPPYSKEKL